MQTKKTFLTNLYVEIYLGKMHKSCISKDIDEVRQFINNYLDLEKSEKAIASLIKQSEIIGSIPNVILFLNGNRESISIDDFMKEFINEKKS